MKKIEYLDQPNCYELSNGTVELIVTTDIGPRIIRYGFPGGENILAEIPDVTMTTELGDWKPWGGHRLWVAPEVMPRSYAPDNSPIQFKQEGENAIRLTAPIEAGTGVQKAMVVNLGRTSTEVAIQHLVTNHNPWAIDLALWGLTIMNGGGVTIIPQEPYRPHHDYLLPARPLVLWHFTNLADPRWTLGRKYLRLKSLDELEEPQKIGAANRQGWMAYHRQDTLFVKRFEYVKGAVYPDFGCNCETYTAASFMEVETLSPIRRLEPGQTADHMERWSLFSGVDIGVTEESLDAALKGPLSL